METASYWAVFTRLKVHFMRSPVRLHWEILIRSKECGSIQSFYLFQKDEHKSLKRKFVAFNQLFSTIASTNFENGAMRSALCSDIYPSHLASINENDDSFAYIWFWSMIKLPVLAAFSFLPGYIHIIAWQPSHQENSTHPGQLSTMFTVNWIKIAQSRIEFTSIRQNCLTGESRAHTTCFHYTYF